MPYSGGSEERKRLDSVIIYQGQPKGYYRIKDPYKVPVTFKNSFNAGSIIVSKNKLGEWLTRASGVQAAYLPGSLEIVMAIDGQVYSGITQRFQNWTFTPTGGSEQGLGSQNPKEITINQAGTYTASFANEYTVNFQNCYAGGAVGGVINVNGVSTPSPTSNFQVVQPNTIHAVVVTYQVVNGVEFTFTNWGNDGSTSADRTFTPTANTTYTANFTGKPLPLSTVGIDYGEDNHILLSWQDHPNNGVTQYQIWRKVTPYGGPPGSPELLTTLNYGTTEFTDYQYYYDDNHLHKLIQYDVRCYFQPNCAYSDPSWHSVYGNIYPGGRREDEEVMADLKSEPVDYRFESFPNPFNPSTQLQYQLKNDADVRLVIHDMLGRTVAELVNTAQKAGTHTRLWNASEMGSGIYFATFVVTPVNEKPFAITKKLMLMK